MPTSLLEKLFQTLGEENVKVTEINAMDDLPEFIKNSPRLKNVIGLGLSLGAIPAEALKEANAAYEEGRKLETELKLLVKNNQIPSYAFTQLYNVLGEEGEAYLVEGPALRVSLHEGQVVDNDGDIIPAFREIIESRFVLVKDYKAYKAAQKATKKDTIMVSKEVALQALEHGQEIQVEFESQGEMVSMNFSSKDGNTALPVQALINGVFYVVR